MKVQLLKTADGQRNNCIRVIKPYKWNGMWVFDDKDTGLEREAFVAGADGFIDLLAKPIPKAGRGFLLLFSDQPFKGSTVELEWVAGDRKGNRDGAANFGNDYRCTQTGAVGWLCPALFLYFKTAPERLYAQGKPISSR